MKLSIKKRLQHFEKANRNNRRIAHVIYDPEICPQDNLPPIEADVILYLPDNGFRLPNEKSLSNEGYLIKYS